MRRDPSLRRKIATLAAPSMSRASPLTNIVCKSQDFASSNWQAIEGTAPCLRVSGIALLAPRRARGFGGRRGRSFDRLPLEEANFAIAAIFGAGLARDIDGAARVAILRLNEWSRRTRKPVVAVDIPSGVDGSTGQVRGVAVEATQTVTFFQLKPGHLLMPGQMRCGEISLVDIGIPESVLATIKPQTFANEPALWGGYFPRPSVEGKNMRGHALVLSGALAHTGAARLAARGALRAGAGLVTVATPSEALAVHAAALTAIMTRVCQRRGSRRFACRRAQECRRHGAGPRRRRGDAPVRAGGSWRNRAEPRRARWFSTPMR